MDDRILAIFQEVSRVLREKCAVKVDVTLESRLGADLKLDSVGMLAMALELENHYGMNLGEEPDNPPVTVGDVVALISTRLSESRGV